MKNSIDRTLTEIESDNWGDADFDSHLATAIHELRNKAIGQFSAEELRITIGQSVGLPNLVPIAISRLERDPLIEGDFYPGDLLSAVLRVAESFWDSNPALRERLLPVAKLARDRSDESDVCGLCSAFVSRWTP